MSGNSGIIVNVQDLTKSVEKLNEKFDTFGDRQERLDRLVKFSITKGNKKKLEKLEKLDKCTDGDDSSLESGDENKERGNWSGQLDFLLSCLGYAVGLGNVWRFPYLCYRNGGGAFFIPYFIMLFFVGLPIFFMELSLGQFSSSGPLTCYRLSPLFSGIGIGMVAVSALVCIYYNMIIAWALFYLGVSLTDKLPWADCSNDWNQPRGDGVFCKDMIPTVNCSGLGETEYNNGTCYIYEGTSNSTLIGLWNETAAEESGIKKQSASEQYYDRYVLGRSSGIENMGTVRWQLVLCLFAAWIIVFLCLIKGVKSSGKVVYFTAIFPYVVLIILFINGMTLDGMKDGVLFYITPQWERLGDARVWSDAAQQIFFSLSTCWGGLITLSSYNRFNNNVLRDSLIVTFGNSITSIFAGFVIFSYLGYMAKELGTTVDKVASSGSGLAFIVYPEAMLSLPVSPLWSVLFFMMLITLGLDSQFALLETVTTSLLDKFAFLRQHKMKVILGTSVLFFTCGLSLCTEGGAYMLQLMDSYAGNWSVLLIGLCECIAIAWVYGWDRFANDIKLMIGSRPIIWWRICWQFLTPAIILFIMFFSWIDYSPATYGDYEYPLWANILGWCMSVFVIIGIPIKAIYMLCQAEGSFLQRLKATSKPTEDWGPALEKHRRLVDYVPNFRVSVDQHQYVNDAFNMQSTEYGINKAAYSTDVMNETNRVTINGNRNLSHKDHKQDLSSQYAYDNPAIDKTEL